MAEERALVTVLLRMASLKAGHYKKPTILIGWSLCGVVLTDSRRNQ
jgi:hypothetical protein